MARKWRTDKWDVWCCYCCVIFLLISSRRFVLQEGCAAGESRMVNLGKWPSTNHLNRTWHSTFTLDTRFLSALASFEVNLWAIQYKEEVKRLDRASSESQVIEKSACCNRVFDFKGIDKAFATTQQNRTTPSWIVSCGQVEILNKLTAQATCTETALP